MGARLRTDVHVWDDEKSAFVVLERGTEVPEKFANLVTNPKAYADPADAEGDGQDDEESDKPEGYAALNVEELKAELRLRELPQTGNKPDLIARLIEADAEGDGQDDEEE
jgi:hypothetical protein